VWFEAFSGRPIIDSVKKSLTKFGNRLYVDLLLDSLAVTRKMKLIMAFVNLNEFEKSKEMGFALEIGVSNFTIAQTQQALDILGEDDNIH